MSYKIVIDSCGELLEQWKQDERFESVPLTLTVGSENIIDDEHGQAVSQPPEGCSLPGMPQVSVPVSRELQKGI